MSEPEHKSDPPQKPEKDTGIRVQVFGRTDVGLVREHNEDNFLVADLTAGNRSIKPEVREHTVGSRGSLFVVCDGMGGAAAGEVASKIGIDTIYEMMQQGEASATDEAFTQKLEDAIREAGVRIFTAAKVNRQQRGMGTTSTAAVLNGPRLFIGQVGDSRAYILRGKRLVQVTKDQSLVQQLVDANQLTEEEARNFDKANIILQALGTAEELHVDLTTVDLRREDVLLMCSDGLTGPVTDELVEQTLLDKADPAEACKVLTDLACEGGGQDNITVIVVRFDGEGLLPKKNKDKVEYRKYSTDKSTKVTSSSLPGGTKAVEQVKEYAEKHKHEYVGRHLGQNHLTRSDVSQRGRAGVLIGVAVIFIVCAVVGGYFLNADTGKIKEEPAAPTVPVETLPTVVKPNVSPASGSAQPMDPSSEPVLAPTPEEAISGTEPVRPPRFGPRAAGAPKTVDEPSTPTPSVEEETSEAPLPIDNELETGTPNDGSQTVGDSTELETDQPAKNTGVEPAPIDDNPF